MYVFDANKPILRNLRAGDGPLERIPEDQRAILFQEKSTYTLTHTAGVAPRRSSTSR